jgi:anthranilate phosphoribosyltransferase
MKRALEKLAARHNLSREEASTAMCEIMEGRATEAQIGAFLFGLKLKGETAEELTGFVQIMRQKSVRIAIEDDHAIDMCGTGGDQSGTFNISTVASFVAAGAGVTVAKHGNRSVSSSCGSADVLRALGVNIEISPNIVEQCINRIGIGFLFAPMFHPSMKFAAKPRAELGMKTCFNMLGPMTNPAGVSRQLVGTFDSPTSKLMADVFSNLRTKRIVLVSSEDGLDEVSLGAPTNVIELEENAARKSYSLPSTSYGLAHVDRGSIRGGSPAENAKIALGVLQGGQGAYRDTVIANSTMALLVAGKAASISEGVARSAESIDSGKALSKLDQLREITTG